MSAWFEIVVAGPEETLRGFTAAFEASRAGRERAILGSEVNLAGEGLAHRLRDLLALGSHHLVFAPESLARALVAALQGSSGESGLAVADLREIAAARLRFSAAAFSEGSAREIRERFLAGPPPGVVAEGVTETEEYDPAARGAELYTPEHAYTYRVSGAFSGPLPGVLEMQRRARDLDFVHVKPLELETRPADAT